MFSASTTYAGSAQQKGTATHFNPQGSVAAGNPSVSDYPCRLNRSLQHPL